jgi:ribonuclease BN (tRNA processing enzyme)
LRLLDPQVLWKHHLDSESAGHAEIGRLLMMAREQNVKKLALTHIQREIRRNRMAEIKVRIAESKLDVIIPEPGDVLLL